MTLNIYENKIFMLILSFRRRSKVCFSFKTNHNTKDFRIVISLLSGTFYSFQIKDCFNYNLNCYKRFVLYSVNLNSYRESCISYLKCCCSWLTTGIENLVSFNWNAAVSLEVIQFSDRAALILILQSIKGNWKVFQKLFKYFKSKAISLSLLPSALIFYTNLFLRLKYFKFAVVGATSASLFKIVSSLKYCNKFQYDLEV